METLRVRAYNVRFGDAILVSVPDRSASGTTIRHILIDVGNVLTGSGGNDDIFKPVIKNIVKVLDGKPLDLYIATHEHLDHIQGLLWAKQKLGIELAVDFAWITASAGEGYYDRFPKAKEKRLELHDEYDRIEKHLAASDEKPQAAVQAMMLNNNPRSTRDCIEYLRNLAKNTSYIFRGADLDDAHPFEEAQFSIWGPEEDTSIYYGRFRSLTLDGNIPGSDNKEFRQHQPPPGVDASAFYNLVSSRNRGVFDNLFAIDKAANNTSVVFSLTWRGWRLLFSGDAEHRAWKEMAKREVLVPVDFLKVSHHGSINGTPVGVLLDTILPPDAGDGNPRKALVSTHVGTYSDVPNAQTLADLTSRCDEVVSIGDDDDKLYVDLEFPAKT